MLGQPRVFGACGGDTEQVDLNRILGVHRLDCRMSGMVAFSFADAVAPGLFEVPPDSPPARPWTRPEELAWGPGTRAGRLSVAADGGAVAAQFRRHRAAGYHKGAVGVWETGSGRLLWWQEDNAVLHPSRPQVLVEATRMGSHPAGGIAHRLVRYAWPEMRVLDDLVYGLPESGVDDLVVSPSGRLLLTYLNSGQGQNGYELFDLDGPLRRLGVGEIFTLGPMACPPVFSPSERLVACSPGPRGTFWTPGEEDWPDDDGSLEELEIPSTGGIATFGSLVLHDIVENVVSTHLLQFDLPPGWVPDDPQDSRWEYGANAVEFPAGDLVRLLLPDGQRAELHLPLPAAVLLPTPAREVPGHEAAVMQAAITQVSAAGLRSSRR
jgi:hypothetical protein